MGQARRQKEEAELKLENLLPKRKFQDVVQLLGISYESQ
jgi:hypothetical protein